MTIVKTCTCNHPGQDAIHGKGQRVHNEASDGKSARCTVCGAGRPKKKPAPGVWTSR